MKLRILLADDHTLLREGLKTLLERESDLQVVADVANGRLAVRKAEELRPDVVVLDVDMPELNGIEAARQLSAAHPRLRIVCLSMHSGARFVDAMLEAGALGYVLKNEAAKTLVTAIRKVAGGEVYLSPEINTGLVRRYVRKQPAAGGTAFTALSDREREVLQLIAEGASSKEISTKLGVSEKTVSTHREHIMAKLDLHNVADLTRYAIREGIAKL
ncbi:MAG: response regulator transcription factor [Kiritimatiellia bacterium]